MESGDTTYIVLGIIAIIIGVIVIKKVAGCLLRLVVLAIVAAVLYTLYMSYTAEVEEEEPQIEMHG